MQRPSPRFRPEECSVYEILIKKICFTQIYRDLYGDVMLVPTWMDSNMADGNQQKHLLPSFGTKGQCEFIPRGTHKH